MTGHPSREVRFFDRFVRRVDITGVLVAETAFRIGAGKGQGDVVAADLPVMRDASGEPLIPGSSLKGVLRSSIESVMRSRHPEDWKSWACDFLVDRCVPDASEDRETRKLKTRERTLLRREQMSQLCLTCG